MRFDFGTIFGPPARAVEVRRGGFLFHRGEPAEAVFAIDRGRLRLERSLRDGALVTLAVLGDGDGVAEASLFTDTYHCDARAEVASRIWVFPRERVLDHLGRDAASMGNLIRHLAQQVRRLRAVLELRAVKRADQRILAYLDLLTALGESWDGERPIRAMAAELGLAPETLYRTLSQLEEEALIVRQGRRISKKS